ncbi:hypothetical protein ACWD25_44260 [Streptomyces sp. NPDC002920]
MVGLVGCLLLSVANFVLIGGSTVLTTVLGAIPVAAFTIGVLLALGRRPQDTEDAVAPPVPEAA